MPGRALLLLVLMAGCHSSTRESHFDLAVGDSALPTDGSAETDGSPGNPDGGSDGGSPSSGLAFSYGLNFGYYNSSLNDDDASQLGRAAGTNSHRHKLTEPFLDMWGDSVHVAELTTMTRAGEQDLICFIVGADTAHSNAPSGGNVENYSPKNLQEPIWLASGAVNPNNYWAAFVARVVTTYHPFIHQWEVWNEPDQVGGNWQATETWDTQPPKATDLVWWNDTIFAYIRMLRVTYEVVHKLDPQGKVTLGGIGYPSYLNALLRYTDEPNAGAVDADHPSKGGAYFDIVSFHYYPALSTGNSDVGANGLISAQAAMQAELDKAGVTGKGFVVTESGAPRYAFTPAPGGDAYAHNYLVKAMVLAQLNGIRRIDWFDLGDDKDPGASTNGYDYMGLYSNLIPVTDPAKAVMTDSGVAYATLGGTLAGSLADPTATTELNLPAGTSGVALHTKNGQLAAVLWATASDENGSSMITLPASAAVEVRAWDYSQTKSRKMISPANGKVQLAVTSSPIIALFPN